MPLDKPATSRLPAISYFRVSTKGQAEDDVSGIDRQERAIQDWISRYGDRYRLEDNVTHAISGARAGRFDWFLEGLSSGRLERGTCLVIERISRFSRRQVTDVMKDLMAIWDAGGAVAVCEISGGRPITSFDDDGGTVYEIVGAIKQSRREWEEKQARAVGSVEWQREQMRLHADGKTAVYGTFQFKPRTTKRREPGYPRWLDVGKDGQWVVLEEEAGWIRKAFQLALDGKGAPTIAKTLDQMGIRQHRGGPISASYVSTLLANRAVLGERWESSKGKSAGCIPAAYPAIVSEQLFQEVQDSRHSRLGDRSIPNGQKMVNLFEKRTICACCGGRLGVRRSRGEALSLFCRTKREKGPEAPEGCPAPNITYDEAELLQKMMDFRWQDFFGDPKRDAERESAAAEVERLGLELQSVQGVIANLNSNIDKAGQMGDGNSPRVLRWEKQVQDLEADLNRAKLAREVAVSRLMRLRRRRSGVEAATEIQSRIKEFTRDGLRDYQQRREFNLWLRDQNLFFVIDTRTGKVEFGVGEVADDRLRVLDMTKEDAAALGLDLDAVRAMTAPHRPGQ